MLPVKLSKILFLLTIIFLILHIIIHYHASKVKPSNKDSTLNLPFDNSLTDLNLNFDNFNVDDLENVNKIETLRFRIREMIRIRGSIRNELKIYEEKRQKINVELLSLSQKLEHNKLLLNRKLLQLDRIFSTITQAAITQKEFLLKNLPFISRPLPLYPVFYSYSPKQDENQFEWKKCQMNNCFDYSRCSLSSPFLSYIYQPQLSSKFLNYSFDKIIFETFKSSLHITSNSSIACVFLVILFPGTDFLNLNSYLTSLSHWSSYGYNHILINLDSQVDILDLKTNSLKALVMQTKFNRHTFRSEFDVIIPPFFSSSLSKRVTGMHFPARRKYLVTYQNNINLKKPNTRVLQIIDALKKIQRNVTQDLFYFRFNCTNDCKDNLYLNSTFVLIFPPMNINYISHPKVINNLLSILTYGAIPVLLGGDYLKLPFFETIDWSKAIINLPISRVTELYYILKSFNDFDITALRRQGKLLRERYFSSLNSMIKTIFSFIQQKRLNIPSLPISEDSTPLFYNVTFSIQAKNVSNFHELFYLTEENLGPIELPFSSLTYQRNISLTFCNGYDLWNSFENNPFFLYPNSPFDPILPSEAQFIDSGYGFRPIGIDKKKDGKEFSRALGGNHPKEQFTIIMLTYEREKMLISSIKRLKGLPYLNRLLIIWNNPEKGPSPDLEWPNIGVSIYVIQSKVNSLNNRFKPYKYIETEAVFSIDDDTFLRHDEIIFAFRVWRESRDRIVGFPGRYHRWSSTDKGFSYHSEYSCELSMVLTGAAFFHKYYLYLYTHSMDHSIRDLVDKYMNCEDIAMNFLVSHITRKPPIKVTSKWTFRCTECENSLSNDSLHFKERNHCINLFSSIYGYNPLLNTQFRVDSVLFKTRVPSGTEKCFKYV